jgi:hypothetical protein
MELSMTTQSDLPAKPRRVPAFALAALILGLFFAWADNAPAQSDGREWRYLCEAKQDLKGGTLLLSNYLTDDLKPVGESALMLWNPTGYDPQRHQRPLDIRLLASPYYQWSQDAADLRKVEIQLYVGLDTDLPQVASLQIQRPFPIEPYGIVGSTALSTEIFPYSDRDIRNGHGEMPLGDLLAYAEGYDTLDWRLIRPSDRLGGDTRLAKGKLNIAALREAIAAVPELRRKLTAMMADTNNAKSRCERTL